MEKSNPNFDIILSHISSNKKPITLVKNKVMSKSLLSYYLRVLKSKGIIRNLGKGVWEMVQTLPNHTGIIKEIRGHAFIWKIKLSKEIKGWDKRQEILTKNNIPFKQVGKTIRIEIKGKKVWLCNKSLIIYEPKSFYESTPISVRIHAVYELIETIKSLESKIGINLGKYKFSVKREHFSIIKNDLANQVNKEGEKIRVRDNGELWFEIDDSYNLDEAEFYKTKSYSGLTNSTGAQGYFNSHKNTHWKVTPEFTLNALNQLTYVIAQTGIQLVEYRKENKEHLKLIKTWEKESIARRKAYQRDIKLTNDKHQSNLNRYF